MSKFNVGDKVRILDGSEISNYAGSWSGKMADFIGEVHTITAVHETWGGSKCPAYVLDFEGTGNLYVWDERGLELVNKFKIGDMVIGNEKASSHYSVTIKGWVGVVVKVYDGAIRVRSRNPIDKHESYVVNTECFDLYTDSAAQKIIITTDGKTTTAVLYDGKKRIKDAKAFCAPTDKFDFNYSASLALDRLTGFVRGQVDCTLEENKSDWDKFIVGEIAFGMTADKYDAFLREVEERFPRLRWYSGDTPTGWKRPVRPRAYFEVQDGSLVWGSSSDKEKVQWIGKSGLDWKKFAEGKLEVKVSKDKYDKFMKLCKKKNFAWHSGIAATTINPWELYDALSPFGKMIVDAIGTVPGEYVYVLFVSDEDKLMWDAKHDEDCDTYEFV